MTELRRDRRHRLPATDAPPPHAPLTQAAPPPAAPVDAPRTHVRPTGPPRGALSARTPLGAAPSAGGAGIGGAGRDQLFGLNTLVPATRADPAGLREAGPEAGAEAAGWVATGGFRGAGRRVAGPPEYTGARKVLHTYGPFVSAALLLCCSLTTLIGDVSWGPLSVLPVLLASLSPFALIAAIPLVTWSLRHRRWAAVVPALVAAGLPWTFVVGYASSAPAPAGNTVPLRAMLVTAHGGSVDADDVVTAVQSQRIDLLVVTELSGVLAHDLTRAGLTNQLTARWVDVSAAGPTGGIGIYSRFPVDRVTRLPGTFWPAVSTRVTVGRATATLVAGRAVQPSIADLDVWRGDLAGFGAAASVKGPVIVLANLNATPWQAQFRRITAGRLHDAGDVVGRGLRPTWPDWALPVMPIDHALVAGGIGVDSLDTTRISGTDHRALTAVLRLPVPAAGTVQR